VTDAEIDAVLVRVKELRAAGQNQEAIDLLTATIQTGPSARLYYARGRTFEMDERREEAVADYTKAIELDSTKPAYYYHRGCVLAHPLNRDEEAIVDFERALELAPDHAAAHQSCCLSYLLVGPPATALVHAIAAVRFASDDALSHFCLGQSFNSLKCDRDSLNAFLRAVELAPDRAHYWSALAGAYQQVGGEGARELALAAISRAIELEPDFAGYFRSRGSLLLDMGRAQEAIVDLQHALTLNPNSLTRELISAFLEQATKLVQ
jgi:tetratricopeptide (TPR) repeat protein